MRDTAPGQAVIPLRVVLTGSESTGKTELAEWLAAELGVSASAEYARDYTIALGTSALLSARDVEAIALGQRAAEDRAIADAVAAQCALVLHDTDLLSTLVYATHYYGPAALPHWLPAAVAERQPDLYLLCSTDVPWHGDPVRDSAADRASVQRAFVGALGMHATPVVAVGGEVAARREVAVGAIMRLVAGRAAGAGGE